MLLHCPACRGQMTAPDSAAGQVVTCPHCQRPVPTPPQRPLGLAGGRRRGFRVMWGVYAAVAGFFALFSVSGIPGSPRDPVSQLQVLTAVVGGYAICRAVERAAGH